MAIWGKLDNAITWLEVGGSRELLYLPPDNGHLLADILPSTHTPHACFLLCKLKPLICWELNWSNLESQETNLHNRVFEMLKRSCAQLPRSKVYRNSFTPGWVLPQWKLYKVVLTPIQEHTKLCKSYRRGFTSACVVLSGNMEHKQG